MELVAYIFLGLIGVILLCLVAIFSIYGYAIIRLKLQPTPQVTNNSITEIENPNKDQNATSRSEPEVEHSLPINEGPPASVTKKEIPNRYKQKDDSRKIRDLESKIANELSERPKLDFDAPLLSICGVLDLDPESPSLSSDYIACIYRGLGLEGQLVGSGPHKIPLDGSVRNMLEAVLDASYGLLKNADENFLTVKSYLPMLRSKKRSLSTRDQYGDEDQSQWIAFSSRFAIDKLKGVDALKIYMEFYASNSNRRTVSQNGLGDMFGGFVRIAMVFARVGNDMEDDDATLSGVDYEKKLQEEILQKVPSASVSMTAATGDHGADLLVDLGDLRIAIQAKYYQSSVGNAAVQEAFSGMGFYGADIAMVVCNSSFTKHAHQLAEKLGVILATSDDYIDVILELQKSSAKPL